jgi:mono/diheme cytochrome c family protein
MKFVGLTAAAIVVATLANGQKADPPVDPVAMGRTFLAENCASCHAIGREGTSPLEAAPPFRVLHERYPVEFLEEALAEGIVTGHPDMPQFQLEPDMIAAVIGYLQTLE